MHCNLSNVKKKSRRISKLILASIALLSAMISFTSCKSLEPYNENDQEDASTGAPESPLIGSSTGVTSGSGLVESETAKCWLTIGGSTPVATVESENTRLILGVSPGGTK